MKTQLTKHYDYGLEQNVRWVTKREFVSLLTATTWGSIKFHTPNGRGTLHDILAIPASSLESRLHTWLRASNAGLSRVFVENPGWWCQPLTRWERRRDHTLHSPLVAWRRASTRHCLRNQTMRTWSFHWHVAWRAGSSTTRLQLRCWSFWCRTTTGSTQALLTAFSMSFGLCRMSFGFA